ncbi:MAG: protein translocase SEC61 complex subunit gamma [Thermoplasmatota archaeon]|nr:protein translocase SEC61 complex subunit gamma [Halobacteriales archaeon]
MVPDERDTEESEEELLDETETPVRRPELAGPPPRTFLERSWAVQRRIERRFESVSRGRIARVLRMARKPETDEFRQSAVIVLVGIAVIGGIGFFVYLLMSTLLTRLTT